MKRWTAILIALLALAFLVTCDKDKKRILDNPGDPESDQYVGVPVRDPADPINVPSVTITDAPTVIKINLAYTYIATASDPNPAGRGAGEIIRWDWNFGNGTVLEDTSATVQYTYTIDGVYPVTVTVMDNDSNTVSHSISVMVTRGEYPVVEAGGPYNSKINVAIPLFGVSSDSDGVIDISGWDIDRNGSIDIVGDTVSWTGTTAGARMFDFIARDDDGNASRDSAMVTLTNILPEADAGGPYTTKINRELTLVGTASDADGTIIGTGWDLDRDGTYEVIGDTARHSWSLPEEMWVRFRAVDDDSNCTVDSARVTITSALPVVDAGGPYTTKVNRAITLTGTTTDADGEIVDAGWDLDGDGTFEASGDTVSHTWTIGGEYVVTYRATDDDQNTVTDTAHVVVTDFLPTADAGGPYSVKINSALTLSGVGSDEDGQVAAYAWDFDGDGVFDWSSNSSGVAEHTYTAVGSYAAAFKVTDDDGNVAIDTTEVTVHAGASPVANAGGPYSVPRNTAVNLNGSASDADGQVVLYEWDFDGDGVVDWTSESTGETTHTYAVLGEYDAILRVHDDDGNATSDTAQVAVTLGNAPVADAGGPYAVSINTLVTLTGTGTDSDGHIVLYEWDFNGDGTFDWSSATSGQVERAYGSPDTYTVTLRVTDNSGNTHTDGSVVVVTNTPPLVDAGGPYTIKINTVLVLEGTASDSDGSVVLYEWDVNGDGVFDHSSDASVSMEHTYATAGEYAVVFRVTDDDDNIVSDTTTVTVTDFTPVADAGGPYTMKINSALSFTGTGSDQDGQVVLYEWDFDGDGVFDWSSNTSREAQHTYTTAETYTAALRVTDDDGNTHVDSTEVVVHMGASPVADAGGPYTTKINVELTLHGTASDEDGQVVLYEWDFNGDGEFEWSSESDGVATYTYSTGGDYTVMLRTKDDDGNTTIDSSQVTVTDFPPVAVSGGPYQTKFGVPLTLSGSGSDEDGQIVLYEWDFDGDGVYDWSSSVDGIAEFTYEIAGEYVAVLRVTDDDGNTHTDQAAITITDLPPVPNSGGPYTAYLEEPLVLNGTATDPDGHIVLYEWDFDGDGVYDWSSTATGVTEYTYETESSVSAALRVTDDDGNTAEVVAEIDVIWRPPVWTTLPEGPSMEWQVSVELNGKICSFGGSNNPDMHCYDPASNTWTVRRGRGVEYLTVASINGKIYANRGDVTGIYDPNTDWWTDGPRGGSNALYRAGGAINGKFYIVGGDNGMPTDIFDTYSNTWSVGAAIPTDRTSAAAAVLDGKLYVAGGMVRIPGTGYVAVATLEIYDPITDQWTAGPSMPKTVWQGAAVAYRDKIWVFGGPAQTDVFVFDPKKNSWSYGPSLPQFSSQDGTNAVVIGDYVYVLIHVYLHDRPTVFRLGPPD